MLENEIKNLNKNQMFYIIISFFSLFSLKSCTLTQTTEKIPNIGYMSYGYNIYLGNPTPTDYTYDPGLTFTSIFDLEYNRNKTTSDGAYLIPDDLDAIKSTACSYETSTTSIYGQTSYYNSISQSLSFSASVDLEKISGSFSASDDWGTVSEDTVANKNVMVSTSASCAVFIATLNEYIGMKFTTNFNNAVETLLEGDENDDALYFAFFDSFGTHYFKQQVLGAKATVEIEFSRSTYNSLINYDSDFTVTAQMSFLSVFSLNSSYSSNFTEGKADEFVNDQTSMKISCLGASPSSNGTDDWSLKATSSPMPIQYKIASISNLFTATNFPNSSIDLLTRVKNRITYYIIKYCYQMNGISCQGPLYERTVPRYSVITTTGYTVIVTCPINQTMIGIGFRRLQVTGNYENFPRYHLTSTTTGECYDYYGVECYGVCTSVYSPDEVLIINSDETTGTTDVTCPNGYKVSGCGFDLSSASTMESYPSCYIYNDFTCRCYTDYNHVCQAICIPNTKSFLNETYQIVTETSTGNFNATCSSSVHVLGCGYLSSVSVTADEYWYVYPQENYCSCYNSYGGTCYAVCADVFQIGTPDCFNCRSDKCSETGCTECVEGYYLTGNVCNIMPCYNICTTCTSQDSCEKCMGCSQSTYSDDKTCWNPYLISEGCIPCGYNYYLNPDGYCTYCTQTSDPYKFRNGSNDGTGRCDFCSNLISNCLTCNDINFTCQACDSDFYLASNRSCLLTNSIDYSIDSSSGSKTLVYVTCPINESLIGIGFNRTNKAGSYEKFPIYMLISSVLGVCYDYYGLTCYAVCSSAFSSTEVLVKNSTTSSGNITISCPKDYMVSGCGLDLDLDSSSTSDTYPSSYMLNSSTCSCYSSNSHICQAICVPIKTN